MTSGRDAHIKPETRLSVDFSCEMNFPEANTIETIVKDFVKESKNRKHFDRGDFFQSRR